MPNGSDVSPVTGVAPPTHTRFGQPGGNPSRMTPETQRKLIENGAMAVSIRNRLLRATERILDSAEAIPEGGSADGAALAALAHLDANMRNFIADSEKAGGITQDDEPAGQINLSLDARQTAMAVFDLMRRGLASPSMENTDDAGLEAPSEPDPAAD